MAVSVSSWRGTPNSSILVGFSLINDPFWGTPIYGDDHIHHSTILAIVLPPFFDHKSSIISWIFPMFCPRFSGFRPLRSETYGDLIFSTPFGPRSLPFSGRRLIANAGHLCKWIDSLHVLVVMRTWLASEWMETSHGRLIAPKWAGWCMAGGSPISIC